MKKTLKLLPISLLVVPIIGTISSCSCNINIGYVPISSKYLNIDGDKLIGFKTDKLEEDLSAYDTLQVPSNVTSVSGFVYIEGYKSYKAIKNIIGDNSGKWTTIEAGAFSSLPELTKVVLPKTITTIGSMAFYTLPKLNTIDLSNITDISIVKSEQFKGYPDTSKQVNNGTIIVKDNNDKTTLANTFKTNDWLKGWCIEIKQS